MKFRIPAIMILVFLISCNRESGPASEKDYASTRKTLMDVNRILVKKDSGKIAEFVKKMDWEMDETETGLWYMIYENGSGEKSQEGLNATINYRVSLLDGTECYSSDSLGPKTFKIGRGSVETGLEEGILLLREGDRARFILPPHLAHGLVGDDNKIPARSIILYDVKLISLKN
jgi:FKBP-type peptidyl-prolyl cis-trans isomerase FkpA